MQTKKPLLLLAAVLACLAYKASGAEVSLLLPEGETGTVQVVLHESAFDGERWAERPAGRYTLYEIEDGGSITRTTLDGPPRWRAPALFRFISSKAERTRLQANADGYWSPPVETAFGEPVELRLYRTGALEGPLPGEAKGHAEILARFREAEGQQADPPVPAGSVACEVAEGRFHCEVPAGTLDVRLEADGVALATKRVRVPVDGSLELK